MSDTVFDVKAWVRRRGEVVSIHEKGDDAGVHQVRAEGDRRARQISKRHWLRKVSDRFCFNGTFSYTDTIKPPKKKEHYLRKSWEG